MYNEIYVDFVEDIEKKILGTKLNVLDRMTKRKTVWDIKENLTFNTKYKK